MGNTNSETSGGNAVKLRLEHASKTGVLSFRELRLEQVPPGVQSVKERIRTLDVSHNKISLLPDNIGSFQNLRSLSCNNNRLGSLPDCLGDLKKLETLHLHFNLLPSLPSSLGSLSSLNSLDLSHNKLTSIPTSLYSLRHLDHLNLSHNLLSSLPSDHLDQLSVLELNISSNSLSSLHPSLAACKRLKVLRAQENNLQLDGLPRQLLDDSCISLLCVEGNLFQQRDLQNQPGYQQIPMWCKVAYITSCYGLVNMEAVFFKDKSMQPKD